MASSDKPGRALPALGAALAPILLSAMVGVGVANLGSIADLAAAVAVEVTRREATDFRLAEKQRDCDQLAKDLRGLAQRIADHEREILRLRLQPQAAGAQR